MPVGRSISAISIVSTILTAGCAGVPDLGIQGPPTVAQIVDKIQCELLEASKQHPRLRSENWQAVIELTLQVDDSVWGPADTFDLTGNLGIIETVDLGLRSVDTSDAAQYQKEKAFGQSIQFAVTKNVSALGPTWTLVRFTGPGGLFGAERIDTHELIISFQKGPVVVTKKGTVPVAIQRTAPNAARIESEYTTAELTASVEVD
jgi:hypothetical protein